MILRFVKLQKPQSLLFSRCLFRISDLTPKPNPIEKTPMNPIYDPSRFHKINDPTFISKIVKEEEQEIRNKNYRFSLSNFKVPMLLLFLTGFLYHCWFTVPYKVVFKHVTISDKYSEKPLYGYSWLLAPLSIRNTMDFIVYFPVMAHALINLNKFLKPRHFLAFYVINGLSCGVFAYFYERNVEKNESFRAKCLGGCSSLGFMAFFWMMKKEHKMFKSRFLPYEIVVMAMIGYELMNRRNQKELNKPAHFLAIFNGLLFGKFFRKLTF